MNNYIKYRLIILTLLFSFCQLKANGYKTELVEIPIHYENLKLSGIINIPDSFTTGSPLIILVPSPQPYNKNSGLFKILADSLSNNGIATFRFDNRSFIDSLKMDSGDPDRFTITDGVEDLNCVIQALNKDSRFQKSKIGLLGHSEGGCIVSVEASRNKSIDFLILLSSIGTKGEYLAYNQLASNMDNSLPEFYPSRIRNFLQHCLYYIPYNISKFKDNDKAKRKIHADIMDLIVNYESDKKELLGKMSASEYAESIVKQFMKPRFFELVRYDPKNYYTKITCPVFIAFGENDELMDYKTQMYSFERLFFSSGKKNYSLVSVKDADHCYRDNNIPCLDSKSREDTKKEVWGNAAFMLFQYILAWMHNDFTL